MLGESRGPTVSECSPIILACIPLRRETENFDISKARMLELHELTPSCPFALFSVDMEPYCEPAELGQYPSHMGQ